MGERLYPNIRKITNVFCIAIIVLTLGLFALRMTALSDMVMVEEPAPRSDAQMIDDVMFAYRVASVMEFDYPGARGSIMAENDEENEHHMRLEIIHEITGKSIYVSPFLAPGASVTSAYLQGELLDPGEHRGTAIITAYNPANRRQVDSYEHPVTIRINEADN